MSKKTYNVKKPVRQDRNTIIKDLQTFLEVQERGAAKGKVEGSRGGNRDQDASTYDAQVGTDKQSVSCNLKSRDYYNIGHAALPPLSIY